jgi:predicted SnoaL-like aldol condensation-catalyzing enzyme/truncated hemoglobin YjbI
MKFKIIISIMILNNIGLYGQTIKNTKVKMTNLEIANAINKAVMAGDVETASSLVRENYIQHTPVVPDGRKGLEILVSKIKKQEIPAPKITNVRTFSDGNFVILHHDVMWPDRKAMFEIFRMENGFAAEHWSGIMNHPEKTANGHTMLDGATEITDKTDTERNKALAKSFVETVLIKGQFDKIVEYYHPNSIQHNPFIDNSVQGLIKGIENLQKQGITIEIQKIWNVFGEGNFVLVCSEGLFTGKHTAFFDLFRMENGKIVEHWDVLQEVPEKSAHENGFFEASLYKRMGGYDEICAFVDLAFPRVAAHPKLEKYFLGHAMESKYRQRQLIIDKLSSTLQGPTIYLGRSLESVHKGLNISADEWDIFMEILTKAMDERNIKGKEKQDFTDIFNNVFRAMTVESELKK